MCVCDSREVRSYEASRRREMVSGKASPALGPIASPGCSYSGLFGRSLLSSTPFWMLFTSCGAEKYRFKTLKDMAWHPPTLHIYRPCLSAHLVDATTRFEAKCSQRRCTRERNPADQLERQPGSARSGILLGVQIHTSISLDGFLLPALCLWHDGAGKSKSIGAQWPEIARGGNAGETTRPLGFRLVLYSQAGTATFLSKREQNTMKASQYHRR